MGPFRRRLNAAIATATATLPAMAAAEVCDKVRPDWVAAAGPQGWLAETSYILASPPALLLGLLVAVALAFPRLWLALPVALLVLAFAILLAVSRQSGVARQAMAEGCIASASPAAAALCILALALLVRTYSVRRR